MRCSLLLSLSRCNAHSLQISTWQRADHMSVDIIRHAAYTCCGTSVSNTQFACCSLAELLTFSAATAAATHTIYSHELLCLQLYSERPLTLKDLVIIAGALKLLVRLMYCSGYPLRSTNCVAGLLGSLAHDTESRKAIVEAGMSMCRLLPPST